MFTSSDVLDEVACVCPPTVIDAIIDPIGAATWAASADPGPDVTACLAVIDPVALPRAAQLDLLVAAQRQIAWLTSIRARALAAVAGRAAEIADAVDTRGEHWTADDVRCALRVSDPAAKDLIDEARQLAGDLAPTLQLLATGQIDPHHVLVLREVTLAHRATPGLLDAVQQKVLPRAVEQTPGELRRSARRAVLRLAPQPAEQAYQHALADRRVVCTAREDGIADLAGGSLASTALPKRHAVKPIVQVTVALSTLLGADQQPGELDGYGPIPAALAMKIAADPNSIWRRLVVDPLGGLVDYGRTTYRPPKDLTDFVITRDQECPPLNAHSPTCHRPARLSDIDHETEWQDGGDTNADNLGPPCAPGITTPRPVIAGPSPTTTTAPRPGPTPKPAITAATGQNPSPSLTSARPPNQNPSHHRSESAAGSVDASSL